jgi:hypothetical protein
MWVSCIGVHEYSSLLGYYVEANVDIRGDVNRSQEFHYHFHKTHEKYHVTIIVNPDHTLVFYF